MKRQQLLQCAPSEAPNFQHPQFPTLDSFRVTALRLEDSAVSTDTPALLGGEAPDHVLQKGTLRAGSEIQSMPFLTELLPSDFGMLG